MEVAAYKCSVSGETITSGRATGKSVIPYVEGCGDS